MNEDQNEGNFKQLKGKAKEAWGKLTDNDKTEMEGKGERMEGKVQEAIGDVKGIFRDDDDRRIRDRRRDV